MNITLYTKDNCTYCHQAKELLKANKFFYEEKKLNKDFTKEWLLEIYPGTKTFPVVVVDGYCIGGYANLAEMINLEKDSRSFLTE